MWGSSIKLRRVHPNGPRLIRPGRERLNSSIEHLIPSLLTQKLTLSLIDGRSRCLTVLLGQRRNAVRGKTPQIAPTEQQVAQEDNARGWQGLFTKSLRQMLSQPPIVIGRSEESRPNPF